MILRSSLFKELQHSFTHFPVMAILGPRQVGKTTLAREFGARWKKGPVTHFDLEDPDDRARLSNLSFTLKSLAGLIILDEVQLKPEIFPLLRVLADRRPVSARFLILGSAAPELLKNVSESLAGRISFLEMQGFSLGELKNVRKPTKKVLLDQRWLRGGFPGSFLAKNLSLSEEWRDSFVRTYLERDIPQLGITLPAATLRRFWTMVAHYHGQTWNGSELGRSLGVTDKTVSRYLDILEGTFMTFRLQPWSANFKKREIKAPKVYLNDSGILHALLKIGSQEELLSHPKCGASWEGFMIGQIAHELNVDRNEMFFWGVHGGAELDLLIVKNKKRLGFEIKLTNSPAVTPSMRSALETLKLYHLYVICHGDKKPWPLSEKITAVPAMNITKGFFSKIK